VTVFPPDALETLTAVTQLRTDPFLGTRVHLVATRQGRPNLPSSGCPFCVGGLEAPEPYDVRAFPNRWPAMDRERCEVVLYTPIHDATLWSLGAGGVRTVIDLWADRTRALGERDDVEFVLVFENRGAEVGATIAHPHGQIYAYDHVPERPRRRLAAGWHPDPDPGERLVATHGDWRAWVPLAPTYPVEVAVAPATPAPDLPSLGDTARDEMAAVLVDVLERLDRLHDRPLPYMMWLNQRPSVDAAHEDAWLNVEIVSPWRAAGVPRFIAAAEVACEEYFNPVEPEDLAARLRALARR
jgi:UDPglucose--hexose-1-phosphate uridylyltransferase